MCVLTYFFITTEHLIDGLWFKDEEDFRTGMNYVAVLSYVFGIKVIAFILMSNHVHFLIVCRNRVEAEAFINEFKRRYSRYYRIKYGVKEFLRGNGVDIQEITAEDEAVERVIAYINVNSVSANICLSPSGYPWGTGDCFFNFNRAKEITLERLSGREMIRILHSGTKLPPEWTLRDGKYIDPASYVDCESVEKIFRTPKRMNYFLANSSKARKALANNESITPKFRDQIIVAAIPDLCYSMFRKQSAAELDSRQLIMFLKQLRARFCADVNQVARVVGLPYEAVAKMLDDICL